MVPLKFLSLPYNCTLIFDKLEACNCTLNAQALLMLFALQLTLQNLLFWVIVQLYAYPRGSCACNWKVFSGRKTGERAKRVGAVTKLFM